MQTYNGCLSRVCRESLLVQKLKNQRRITLESDSERKNFVVNTQQVLAVSAQTGKQLRLHRPIRFASLMPDWLPDSMADTGNKVIRLSWMPSPKQQTFLLDEQKWLFSFFLVFRRSLSPLLCVFDLILILWGICKVKNGFIYKCSEKCVCRIMCSKRG